MNKRNRFKNYWTKRRNSNKISLTMRLSWEEREKISWSRMNISRKSWKRSSKNKKKKMIWLERACSPVRWPKMSWGEKISCLNNRTKIMKIMFKSIIRMRLKKGKLRLLKQKNRSKSSFPNSNNSKSMHKHLLCHTI